MLSSREQDNLREFFEKMPFADVADIAKSITKRNLTPTSLEDAICIICQHSDCVEAILEKRKVTKRYLSEYLHRKQVSIPHSWDKPALIRNTIHYWNRDASSSTDEDGTAQGMSTAQNQSALQSTPEQVHCGDDYYTRLCYEFSKWYYSLLNDDDLSKLGPEHFFDESQMQVALLSGDDDAVTTDTMEAHDSQHAAAALRQLKARFRLKFLPNLAPGAIQLEHGIHGQVKLFVSGTLHAQDGHEVVGLFEQRFLLIRDFADNENWKIKGSQVVLRSGPNNALMASQNPAITS